MKFLFALFAMLFTQAAQAKPSSEYLLTKLLEAQDYLQVKPSFSSTLLKKDLSHIGVLAIDDQLRWQQNLLRASISLNDLTQVEKTVRAMLLYPELDKKTDKFVSLLSSLGIFMRRLGHHDESIWLFDCGLKQPITEEKQTLSLLASKGVSLRQLTQNNEAKEIYKQALVLAEKTNNDVFKSIIFNTLGIMAIYEDEFVIARQYLLQSIQISQKISRRSGHVMAGLNLLMLSILQQEMMLYQRLHYPISRLALASKNQDRHIYLFWIEKAHQVLNGDVLSEEDKVELLSKLEQVKDFSLHNLMAVKLSKPLGLLSKARMKQHSTYKGDLLNDLHQCK